MSREAIRRAIVYSNEAARLESLPGPKASIFDGMPLPLLGQEQNVSLSNATDSELLRIPKSRDQMIRRLIKVSNEETQDPDGPMTYFNKRQPMEQSLPTDASEATINRLRGQESFWPHEGYRPAAIRPDWR